MAGNPNPIENVTGLASTANVDKAQFVSWAKDRLALVVDDASELNGFDLSSQRVVILFSTGATYLSDVADTTTVDDGVNCIRDANGLAFKIVS